MKGFSLQRIAVIAAIIVPIEVVYSFVTAGEVTLNDLLQVIILILIVDIVFVLFEKKKT